MSTNPTFSATAIGRVSARGGSFSMGIFATRSPVRPNSIAASVARVLSVDLDAGAIRLAWMDAEDGSPALDIKPYHPCTDRVRDARMPARCAHWPDSWEAWSSFDWAAEFVNAR